MAELSAAGLSPSKRSTSVRSWITAARPATLLVGVVPVLVGSAIAGRYGRFELFTALAALFGALCIQVGTNFVNDLCDFDKGADTSERLGPKRAMQAGLLTRSDMKSGILVVFGLAVAFGIYLTWVAGPVVVAIGVFSILSAVAYTAGPKPLAYVGLGDVFVMLFFGFVAVCGTVHVQMGAIPVDGYWASIPVGSLATAVLVVNNLRDRHQDAKVAKRTLAVRWGRRFSIGEYITLCVASYVVPIAWLVTSGGSPSILLPLICAPLAIWCAMQVAKREGADLNPLLGRTAQLLVVYGVLLAGALLL